jgi:hypothetical protein
MVGRTRAAALCAACLAALALASCASFQKARDRDAVAQVARLVNAGQAEKLAAMSAVPFLVDGEIVPLAEDVAGFWAGVAKAGYRLTDPTLERGDPVDARTCELFGGSMETRAFFAASVPNSARVVRLGTRGGGSVLLVVAPAWTGWRVMAWKGPF